MTTCPYCAQLLSGLSDDSPYCPGCLRAIHEPERRTALLIRRCIIGAFVLAAMATVDYLLLTWLHPHF